MNTTGENEAYEQELSKEIRRELWADWSAYRKMKRKVFYTGLLLVVIGLALMVIGLTGCGSVEPGTVRDFRVEWCPCCFGDAEEIQTYHTDGTPGARVRKGEALTLWQATAGETVCLTWGRIHGETPTDTACIKLDAQTITVTCE